MTMLLRTGGEDAGDAGALLCPHNLRLGACCNGYRFGIFAAGISCSVGGVFLHCLNSFLTGRIAASLCMIC